MKDVLLPLHAFALTLADATPDIACQGTAIESRTAKVRGKAFLFVGAGVVRLKLGDSLAEARACAAKEPGRYEVGAGGWIKITAKDGKLPAASVWRRWIRESHALCAGTKPAAPAAARSRAKRGNGARPARGARRGLG